MSKTGLNNDPKLKKIDLTEKKTTDLTDSIHYIL
jgi:hypothetical protein